jgi:hypothetical protein
MSAASAVSSATHRDPDGRVGHRRRVVHAVADHGHPPVLPQQVLDGPDLVVGQEFGAHLVDAQLPADGVADAFVIPCQHDEPVHPETP